jgi:type II secretory pathway component PulF
VLTYQYEALDGNGNLQTGLRVAQDEESLHRFFDQQGLTPVSLEKRSSFRVRPRKQMETLSRFFRNLKLFLSSGMELLPALQQVRNRIEGEQIQACVDTVIQDLKNGRSFGDSLRSCEPFFPVSAHRICAVGEQTGNLEEACEELAEYFQSQNEFLRNLFNLMLYPLIVMGVGVLVLTVLFAFVIPQLKTMIPEGQSLPWISQIVFGMSWFFQGWRLLLLGGLLGGLVAGGWALYRSSWGQRQFSQLLHRSTLYRKIRLQLFSLAMAMCTRVGLDMSRALTLGRQVLGNPIMQERMNGVIEEVRRGHTLTDSLANHDFTLIPLDSLAAGEQSGNLEDVFRFHAELLEEEIDDQLSQLITIIEPLVVALMAVFVGLIMAAVMLPIFQMSSTL